MFAMIHTVSPITCFNTRVTGRISPGGVNGLIMHFLKNLSLPILILGASPAMDVYKVGV